MGSEAKWWLTHLWFPLWCRATNVFLPPLDGEAPELMGQYAAAFEKVGTVITGEPDSGHRLSPIVRTPL